LAGAAKEIALAYRFGIGELTDVYVTLMTFVLWPVALWLTVVTATIVPLEARTSNAVAISQFRSELTAGALTLGILLALAAIALMMLPSASAAPGNLITFPPAMLAMIPVGVLLIPLGLMIGLWSTWTLGSGRHTNTLLEGVPALVVAVVVITMPELGASGLVWATVAGFLAHLLLLGIPLVMRGELPAPSVRFESVLWRPFFSGFGLLLAGQALMASVVLIDQSIAVGLGSGAPSTLSYSNRVLAFVMGLGALAVTRATLPVFAKAAERDPSGLSRVAGRWALAMLICGLAVAALSAWLAEPVVSLLFERGAFTYDDKVRVAALFRASLPQMPLFLAGLVLASVASSRGRYGLIFVACASALTSKIAANALLVPHWGLVGLVLGWTVMYTVHATVLLWGFTHRASGDRP
jgi:peptidoglycan biosynthesis protein MviN/MurJ (putative lipid II flippase)